MYYTVTSAPNTMNEAISSVPIFLFALASGIRHGIDLDHIAAITDITSSQGDSLQGFVYATLYGLGHGLMIIGLGVILLTLGANLPDSIDHIFGKFVGVTLVGLGLYVLYSIFKDGRDFKIKSRWMLIFNAISFGYHKLLHNFKADHHHPKLKSEKYGAISVIGIGMIHGVGAETPTQIGAFLVLLGIGGGVKAFLFLLFFVLGIFISNLAVAGFSLYGYKKAMQNQNIYIAVGLITAIFSIALGILFLL